MPTLTTALEWKFTILYLKSAANISSKLITKLLLKYTQCKKTISNKYLPVKW